MPKYWAPFSLILLVVIAGIALACGNPSHVIGVACNSAPSSSNGDVPESVSVCPAAADASNYPGGLVQFVAIGEYSSGPSPALPTSVIWGVCQDSGSTTGVTVSSKGVAQCASGASGTYDVWATAGPVLCLAIGPCGECGPTGTAHLTCP